MFKAAALLIPVALIKLAILVVVSVLTLVAWMWPQLLAIAYQAIQFLGNIISGIFGARWWHIVAVVATYIAVSKYRHSQQSKHARNQLAGLATQAPIVGL